MRARKKPSSDVQKSKSQRKREHLALQALAEALVRLPPGQLAQVPLDAALGEAVALARRLERGALRRQIRYLARLLDEADADRISGVVRGFARARREDTARLQRIERWRARLIEVGDGALEELVVEFPGADRQRLRAMLRSARGPRESTATTRAYRALFRYLRELDPGDSEAEQESG